MKNPLVLGNKLFIIKVLATYVALWALYYWLRFYIDMRWVHHGLEWMLFFTIQGIVINVLWLMIPNILGVVAVRFSTALLYLGIRLGMGVDDVVAYVLCFGVLYLLYMVFELMILLSNLQVNLPNKRV